MIRVTGMSFTPIHDFLPKKISPDSANGLTPDDTVIDERYIALTNNISTNFADEYQIQQSQNDTSAEAITLNDGALVN